MNILNYLLTNLILQTEFFSAVITNTFIMASLLPKFIMGSKYGGVAQFGRDNHQVLYIQEPVGYVYFTKRNISTILIAIHKVHPGVEFSDIQDVMVNLFHTHGSSAVQHVDSKNEREVTARVNTLNKETISETNRRFGNNLNLHQQYQTVLDHPNRIPARPKRNRIWKSSQLHPLYGKDVPDSMLPAPTGEIDDLGLSYSLILANVGV